MAEFRAWLASSRERQGLPMKITDLAALEQIAVLLGKPQAGKAKSRSHTPERLHPVDIQRPRPTDAGADDSVIQDCFDDGAAAVQGQLFPLAA